MELEVDAITLSPSNFAKDDICSMISDFLLSVGLDMNTCIRLRGRGSGSSQAFGDIIYELPYRSKGC